MATVRKLQAEVERTLKKIDEGLKDFDDMYEKVLATEGPQKQRLEGDLKTEIKKLQKLRDQVKTWAAGPEIKNKQALTEAREKIERRMEAFKVVERETKTKAYSKEGLARTQALSDEERRRLRSRDWVQEAVSKLGDQIDEFEAEVETLSEGGRASKKDREAVARLEGLIRTHRMHQDKLEALTRLLDNGGVKPDDVDGIQDDVAYYLSQARAPDDDAFEADFGFYDAFDLQGDEEGSGSGSDDDNNETLAGAGEGGAVVSAGAGAGAGAGAAAAALLPVAATAPAPPASAASVPSAVASAASTVASSVAGAPATPSAGGAKAATATKTSAGSGAAQPAGAKVPAAAAKIATPASPQPQQPAQAQMAAATATASKAGGASPTVRGSTAATATAQPPGQTAAQLQAAQQQAQQAQQAQQQAQAKQAQLLAQQQAQAKLLQQKQLQAQQQAAQTAAAAVASAQAAAAAQQAAASAATTSAAPKAATARAQAAGGATTPVASLTPRATAGPFAAAAAAGAPAVPASAAAASVTAGTAVAAAVGAATAATNTAAAPSASSVVGPARPEAAAVALALAAKSAAVVIPEPVLPNPWAPHTLQQLRYGAALVSASLAHVPEAADERARAAPVRQPHATHASFPAAAEHRLPFERLTQDTLFFIFYYGGQGYEQFLAARELRTRHAWRFHRGHRTWFQRHEEPRLQTDEGEGGAFVFFDYEADWAPRVAKDFYFAYSELEE